MKVLVIGGGGREHALAWKIAQSPLVTKLYCAPGNPGTATLAENLPIAVDQLDKLLAFAFENRIDLTVVGPEQPSRPSHGSRLREKYVGPRARPPHLNPGAAIGITGYDGRRNS